MGKFFKFIFKAIGVLILVGIVAIIGVAIFSGIKNSQDKKSLKNAGYVQSCVVGSYELNARIYGKTENAKHVILAMSDLGVMDTTVTFEKCLSMLDQEETEIVILDRAGYGLSNDTGSSRSIETIVEEYRTAIDSLNVEGPYILMASGVSGLYATAWANLYPDDLEAIIYLDSTIPTEDGTLEEYDEDVDWTDFVKTTMLKWGWNRFFYKSLAKDTSYNFSEESRYIRLINTIRTTSYALLNETKQLQKNAQYAYDCTDGAMAALPKLYINASYSFTDVEEVRDYWQYVNQVTGETVYDLSNETTFQKNAEEFIEECQEKNEKYVQPYLERIGNVKEEDIPGDSLIYEYAPEAVAAKIYQFVMALK